MLGPKMTKGHCKEEKNLRSFRLLVTNEYIQHENDREEQIDDHHGMEGPVWLSKHVADRVVLATLRYKNSEKTLTCQPLSTYRTQKKRGGRGGEAHDSSSTHTLP